MEKVRYVRLQRQSTESWITFRLAHEIAFGELLDEHLAFVMPGWELVSGCIENPDDEEVQCNDEWPRNPETA